MEKYIDLRKFDLEEKLFQVIVLSHCLKINILILIKLE